MYQVITFYKYVNIPNSELLKEQLKEYCKENNIFGRILIACEGINGGVSGEKENIEKFKKMLKKNPLFTDITFREQEISSNSYHKLVIKVREEVCMFREKVDLSKKGDYIDPRTLKEWYKKGKDFVIIDARNGYEYDVGHFKGAKKLPIEIFSEFPKEINKLNIDKNKEIVLYCTGGIRCEKASAFMKQKGYNNVYHIQGGIINYLQQVKNEEWEGGLFVFDDRIVSSLSDPITKCIHCGKKEMQYINCHNLDCDKLVICCKECGQKMNNTCSKECKEAKRHRIRAIQEF